MKRVKVRFKEGDIEYETSFTFKRDWTNQEVLSRKQELIDSVIKNNPKATNVKVMVKITNPPINKKVLYEIGQEIASGWGACCTSVDTYEDEAVFHCNEYGERFTTTMTYADIKKDYKSFLN